MKNFYGPIGSNLWNSETLLELSGMASTVAPNPTGASDSGVASLPTHKVLTNPTSDLLPGYWHGPQYIMAAQETGSRLRIKNTGSRLQIKATGDFNILDPTTWVSDWNPFDSPVFRGVIAGPATPKSTPTTKTTANPPLLGTPLITGIPNVVRLGAGGLAGWALLIRKRGK